MVIKTARPCFVDVVVGVDSVSILCVVGDDVVVVVVDEMKSLAPLAASRNGAVAEAPHGGYFDFTSRTVFTFASNTSAVVWLASRSGQDGHDSNFYEVRPTGIDELRTA